MLDPFVNFHYDVSGRYEEIKAVGFDTALSILSFGNS